MKKIVFVCIALLFAWGALAQTNFNVPERDTEKYYPRAQWVIHYTQIVALSHAKSIGQSAEEFGNYCGDLYKLTWDKSTGFNGFVQWTIYNFDLLSEGVEIISQSKEKVVIRVKGFHSELKNKELIYDVTYDEYIQFMQSSHNRIAEVMGSTIDIKINNDELEVTIKPLQRKVVLNLFTPYMYWSPQTVNGWVKEIKYETFKGVDKNGRIEKGAKLLSSELQNNQQRLNKTLYFDKKGNHTSYSEETDQHGHKWNALFNYKNNKVETMIVLKNGIPVSKGDMYYEGCNFLGSNWFSFEDNELTLRLRVETDKHGNAILRKDFDKNNVLTSQGPKLLRDKNGVVTEQSILKKDGTVNFHVNINYDENGLPVTFHRTIAEGKKVDETFKAEYEFDENGNWIKQIQYGPPVNNIFIVERTFTFYKTRKAIKLDDKTLELYVGKYQVEPDFFITITKEENKIFAQGTNQNKFEITPFEQHKFFTNLFPFECVFELNKKGKITGLTIFQNGEYKAKKIE